MLTVVCRIVSLDLGSPQVEIVIPDCFLGNVIHCFQNISPTRDQFCLIEVPVHAFTEEEFIRTFIKTGNVRKLKGP